MARLFTSGFEINTTSQVTEWATIQGSPTLDTATLRSGSRSGRIASLVSGTRKYFNARFIAVNANGPYYLRFYLNVATAPSAANTIAGFQIGFGTLPTSAPRILLNADRSLSLYLNSTTQVGSASSPLTAGVWYEIGFLFNNSPASGSKILRAYIDGVEFASATNLTNIGGAVDSFSLGGNLNAETQTQGDWYLDDVALNDSTGSAQNGMPPSGKVTVMFPNAAGDSNQWNNTANAAGSSNNYQLVDENPPNDATDMVQSGTLNNLDLYNFETTDVGAEDTVNVVHVSARHRNNISDATTAYALVVQKTSGGTQAQGTSIVPASSTWRGGLADSGNTTFTAPSLTTYTDPDGAAWTSTTLNSMQAGPKLVTAGTNRVQVSTVWATVDYTPAPTVRFYLANAAAEYTPATVRGAWDDSSATLARKLGYNPEGAATTAAVAETSASGTHDVLVGRWISPPATSAGTVDGVFGWAFGWAESDAAADMRAHLHIYVTEGDTDTVRGTLYTDMVSSTEFTTAGSGRGGSNWPVTNVAVSVGDRIVVEIGYQAQNVATTSYTGTLHYGNTGTTDLTHGSANITTEPGWIEFTGAYGLWDENAAGTDGTATPAAVAAAAAFPAVTTTASATATPAAIAATAAFPAPTATGSLTRAWTAEGGSDETTITTGNSGGASGDPFDTVNIGTAATLVYDTAQFAHGSLSMRHATGATSTTANAIWTSATLGTPARVYGRFYLRLSALDTRSVMRVRSAGTQIARVQVDTSGQVELRNSGNSVVASSTATLSANTWYRIEFDIRPGAAVSNELRIYAGDSTTLIESVSGSSNYSAATTVDEVGFGNFANGSNLPDAWYDSIQVNDSALPGPAGGGATAEPAAVAAVAAFPAVTVTADAVAAPAAVAVTVAMPAPTVTAGSTATPAAVAAAAAMPALTASAGSTVTPAAVAVAATLETPTVIAGGSATATPAPVAAVAAMPAVGISANSTTTPDPVAATAALPAPTPTVDGTRTPAAIAATTTIGAPTVTAGAAATPTVVAAMATLPTPTPAASADAAPQVLTVVTVIPTPAVDANSPATATPAPVAALATILQATATASGTAVVSPVTVVAGFPPPEASAPGSRRPGAHTAGAARATHGAGTTRPGLTAGTSRGE